VSERYAAAERISPAEWLLLAVLLGVPLSLLGVGIWLVLRLLRG